MKDFRKSVQTIQMERGADYRAFPLFGAVHWAERHQRMLCARNQAAV